MKGEGLESDLRVLTNYGTPPKWKIDLLTRAYGVFSKSSNLDFAGLVADKKFREIVDTQNIKLLGGPMLGQVSETGGSVWIRTVGPASVTVRINDRSNLFGPVGRSYTLPTFPRRPPAREKGPRLVPILPNCQRSDIGSNRCRREHAPRRNLRSRSLP